VELSELATRTGSRILLVVIDGLGGMADDAHGTELEDAATPHLDRLAAEGVTGLLEPVGPGITPGSGPGHLALFGYDPLRFVLGRGALGAAGLGVPLHPGDVAARGNLCTIDAAGTIVDRRAGRISDEEGRRVVGRLATEVPSAEFHHEKGHRLLVVFRVAGTPEALDPRLGDTDPQTTGVPPLEPRPLDPAAEATAKLVASTLEEVRVVLADESAANGLVLRGFDTHRDLPSLRERTGLRAAAVAVYPMYRGIAELLGFQVLGPPADLTEQVRLLEKHREDADLFFVHVKDADAAGEDGDRAAKVAAIERVDDAITDMIAAAEPGVVAVTGDHATPSQMAAHSWHPVPVVVHGPRCGQDGSERFGERWCRAGGLGIRPSKELLPILMANAGHLTKYGA
jgi:2,3-bisphosphoglycerate-independent phosphoglycerate mutase